MINRIKYRKYFSYNDFNIAFDKIIKTDVCYEFYQKNNAIAWCYKVDKKIVKKEIRTLCDGLKMLIFTFD